MGMQTYVNWLKNFMTLVLMFAITIALIYLFQFVLRGIIAQEIKNTGTYAVVQVFDGDTIEVLVGDKKEKVRIIGVDTPETGGNGTDIECYGAEATAFTRSLLEGRRVSLASDPVNSSRDRYDRLLRYVVRDDGLDVNYEILRRGYSPEYSVFPLSRQAEFAQAAQQAEQEGLGLWGSC